MLRWLLRIDGEQQPVPPAIANPQTDTVIFGFDSAWTDRSPGAICALGFDQKGKVAFHAPKAVLFEAALDYIGARRQSHACAVVALDQPTIVPNQTGMRPAERVAGALLGFTGGGVQPAYRKKNDMFGDGAPIWTFKEELGAEDDPEKARHAAKGTYLIEVFPALALPGLVDSFGDQLGAPKYNPHNSKFSQDDWIEVVVETAALAYALGLPDAGFWCSELPTKSKPTKKDQDCLDAAICVLVGFIWRACARDVSALIGDAELGYIIAPVSATTRARMASAARKKGVPFS